jgi:2-polyprenyl-3-methyl-5-hydroxy-6-metoxy-1,4-benzoquinol methylase
MAIVATNQTKLLTTAIRELAEYRGQDPVATGFNVGNSFFATNEIWHASDPKTPAEVMKHYRTCEPQVEQQVFATYGIPNEIALRERIQNLTLSSKPATNTLRVLEPQVRETVLDFGAGIGSQLLPFANRPAVQCTHVDVGGVMMKYAAWRYRRCWPVEFVELKDDYLEKGVPELKGRTFDLVICTEVLEHLIEPEKLVAMLASYVKLGGLCVATVSFDNDDGMVPMHMNVGVYDNQKFLAEVFPKYDLEWIDENVFRKV